MIDLELSGSSVVNIARSAVSEAIPPPHRVFLIDPLTDRLIETEDGRKAYIDVLSTNSRAGQLFGKKERRIRLCRERQIRSVPHRSSRFGSLISIFGCSWTHSSGTNATRIPQPL